MHKFLNILTPNVDTLNTQLKQIEHSLWEGEPPRSLGAQTLPALQCIYQPRNSKLSSLEIFIQDLLCRHDGLLSSVAGGWRVELWVVAWSF